MQRIAILVAAALLAGCETPPVTKEEMSSVDYGPRPTRWQEEIRSYLGIRLTDPKSAIIEFRTEPKQMYQRATDVRDRDRKSTRLNSSHTVNSYAVFCL